MKRLANNKQQHRAFLFIAFSYFTTQHRCTVYPILASPQNCILFSSSLKTAKVKVNFSTPSKKQICFALRAQKMHVLVGRFTLVQIHMSATTLPGSPWKFYWSFVPKQNGNHHKGYKSKIAHKTRDYLKRGGYQSQHAARLQTMYIIL